MYTKTEFKPLVLPTTESSDPLHKSDGFFFLLTLNENNFY